jgi:deoxyribonuclease-4
MDAACAIEADAVIFHLGSHLGAGFETGLERVVPALRQVLDRSNERTWLLVENSAGAGGTIGRSIDELAAVVDASTARAPRCLPRPCHLFVSGVDVTDSAVMNALVEDVDARIGPTACARCTRTMRRLRSGRPGPPRQHRGRADGEGLGALPRTPEVAGYPSCSRCRSDGGPERRGDRKLRELHARAS